MVTAMKQRVSTIGMIFQNTSKGGINHVHDDSGLYFGGGVGNHVHRRRRRPRHWEVRDMNAIANLISMLDFSLDSQRKRHIVGGILISVSTLFGGLALTVMTLKTDEEDYDESDDQ